MQKKPLHHTFSFDPTHGYTPEAMRAIAPPRGPDDFDAFWQETYRATLAQPMELTTRERAAASPAHRLLKVHYRTLDGVAAGAWLVQPRERPVRMAIVQGHGYGGTVVPWYPNHDAAMLFICSPGFDLSAQPGLPNTVPEHVVHGLTSRETYLIRHCVANLWSAAWVMRELVPAAREVLAYSGGSFCGGLGALALPWEPAYHRAYLEVPTFGHQELRMQLRCEGSGHYVQQYVRQHPEALEVLRYFDAATAALRIQIPVLCVPAHFDPAVPPAGQMAVANALRATGHIVELSAGHFDHPGLPGERAQLEQRIEAFLWAEAPAWPSP